MQLSTRGRYAVMAMLDLANMQVNQGISAPVTLHEISDNQEISLSYLEQLFAKLRKKGLVSSTRGPGGGYKLARDAKEIMIFDIVEAVNENIKVARCGDEGGCMGGARCNAHFLWKALGEQIAGYLKHVSLEDVLVKKL